MKNFVKAGMVVLALAVAGCASAPEPEPEAQERPDQERNAAVILRTVARSSGFGEEMPEEFGAAEAAFDRGEELLESDPEAARSQYIAAADNYRTVIREGSSRRFGRFRQEVQSNREEAVAVRAEVAQRELFEQAEEDRERGEELLEEEEYEAATAAFTASRDGFAEAHRRARIQRDRALQSLENLDGNLTERQQRLEAMQQELEADNEN